MQLSFVCPSCGKDYKVPWSMAGKKARCKQCWDAFTIPIPFEATPPQSSDAIPVLPATESRRPTPVLPSPREVEPEVILQRGAVAPSSRVSPELQRARPGWVIPAVAGGGFALLMGLALVLALRPSTPEPDGAALVPIELAKAAGPVPVAPALAPASSSAVAAPVVAPVGLTSTPSPADPALDKAMSTAEVVARYEPSVALIKGKKGSGTGFVARAGVVATNAHVIAGERVRDLEIRFPSADGAKKGPFPTRILYQDKGRDLALLEVAADLEPVRVAQGYRFRKGEDVTVIGNPGVGGQMILENAVSRGIVSSMTRINDQVFLQLGISINPGNSGGPVFDPKGRVIGVVTLKTAQQEGLAFAIPADDLIVALDKAASMVGKDSAERVKVTAGGAPSLGSK